jgi:predicted GH43/DUF377 family glycosyl hydrolase
MVDVTLLGCNGGWRKYSGNPVIGGELGECYDMAVLEYGGRLRMYFSWRTRKSIAMSESDDGLTWTEPEIVLAPRPDSGWEDDVNRLSVIERDGRLHMWYSGQVWGNLVNEADQFEDDGGGRSSIGYAVSDDGISWERRAEPVLVPEQAWESKSLMCPHVMWDDDRDCYRMWYSAGGWFEPDAIGHATSDDGITWTRYEANPVFRPDPSLLWERERTTAGQVIKHDGWYIMFYIGFEDIDKARICAARSRDGLSDWQRHKDNPLISGGRANGWDCEAAYKPFAIMRDGSWTMYYNGRKGFVEQIGVAFHDSDLGFQQ